MAGFFRRQWQRVASWFEAEAEHVTVEFIDEPGPSPILPYGGYLRVFLSEGFLAKAAEWGGNQFPALHGGVSLDFLGAKPVFSTFSRPPEKWKVPGAQLDFPVCPLLPFQGGVVEVEAA